jgi:Zn-dependent M28 family amino/carboxypeptidase
LLGENVSGFLEGTDKKNEVVVISAHYDHLGKNDSLIYYGADDDGSGTSAVIELAKIFSKAKKDGHGPRRSMLFLTFSGEEMGLLGSSYYVKHPLIPMENTDVDLNIDMIGRTDPVHDSLHISDYVYVIGSGKLSSKLKEINEEMNSTYTKLKLDYKYDDSADENHYYYRSDHYNFAKNNIPIIFYFNGTHADYHQPTDTPDKIDFELLSKRSRLVFHTARNLANREDRILPDKKNEEIK